MVIGCLDSVDARRWLNSTLVGIARNSDSDSPKIIPFIDGGSEGLGGQARVIVPTLNACFECGMELIPPAINFPMCTLASHPRLPEHCVEFCVQEFPKVHGRPASGDNPDDVAWLLEKAQARAQQFGIEGVTHRLTLGVVKHIIPAVASTNAIVAAACVNEALKIATNASYPLNNYMQYSGREQPYTFTFPYERKPNCLVCADEAAPTSVDVAREQTVQGFLDMLSTKAEFQFRKPGLLDEAGNPVYLSFLATTHANLTRALVDFVPQSGGVLQVTDPSLPRDKYIRLALQYPPA